MVAGNTSIDWMTFKDSMKIILIFVVYDAKNKHEERFMTDVMGKIKGVLTVMMDEDMEE